MSAEPDMSAENDALGTPARSDADFMRAALALARRGFGQTAENPAVGALIVRNGVVLSQGWTQPGGRPHAEAVALAAVGEGARGATLYVTLEPCSHFGKTPPCADAVIAAGLARVVSALEDPDARVAGSGHARLRDAGLEVTIGICAEEALRANLGHFLRLREGRPAVTLKLAETLDGYAAGDEHDRRLPITSAPANSYTNVARAMHDAVMIGAGTAREDDPLLTVRGPGLDYAHPLRVVLDAGLTLPAHSRLALSARETPVLAISAVNSNDIRAKALQAMGVELSAPVASQDGRLDLRAALQTLAARKITRVFSEGGPRVAADLIAQGLADTVILFTAPKPLGRPGVAALSDFARKILGDSARYRLVEDGFIGPDRIRRYERVL